jgi:hypothetical protein
MKVTVLWVHSSSIISYLLTFREGFILNLDYYKKKIGNKTLQNIGNYLYQSTRHTNHSEFNF